MSLEPEATGSRQAGVEEPACCPLYHEAVELIGRRWTGAIVAVLLDHGPLRFSEIAHAVPELSDRLLSERMKELEARGVVTRQVEPGPPVRVEYALTPMGRELRPALRELRSWAQQWLAHEAVQRRGRPPARTL
jgi:DNA-binding HxlR family transcriptional regulator